MTEEFQSDDRQDQAQQRDMDSQLEQEVQAALGDMSIEDMMAAEEAKEQPAAAPRSSGVRQGRVIGVHGEDIFVHFGGKTQGLLQVSQFEEGEVPSEGDIVEVTVEGYDDDNGLLILSRKGAVLEATWDSLHPGAIVEGRVTGLNKGGLEVDVNGIRAFLPASQVEIGHVEDLSPYLNERVKCEVQEVDRKDNNVVISRRKLLEAEAAKAKQERLETLKVGDEVTGTVRTLKPYGAFVDIGGLDGLLHISDMSHAHVDKPEDVVKVGDEVTVKVLKIQEGGERIGLGLKQTQADPWRGAAEKWQAGQVVGGRVTRLADFGAFVELETGVEGLIPISEFTYGRRIGHAREVLSEGDAVQVKVLNVDEKRKRISLSLKQMQEDPWTGASARWPAQSIVDGRVTRTTDFGAFVEVAEGVEGLIHISQLSDNHVRDVEQVVRAGDTIKAAVLSVDEDSRRMSLSIKAMSQISQPQQRDFQTPSKPRKRNRPLKGGLD